jgi:hypothetical protein
MFAYLVSVERNIRKNDIESPIHAISLDKFLRIFLNVYSFYFLF